jgi:hypothetical protein
MAFDSGKLLNELLPKFLEAGIGVGVSAINRNQIRKDAQGEANRIKEESDKAYAIAMQQAQNLKLLKEAGKAPPKEEKSKLPLYIGLGVGGVVVLGVIIFAVTRK